MTYYPANHVTTAGQIPMNYTFLAVSSTRIPGQPPPLPPYSATQPTRTTLELTSPPGQTSLNRQEEVGGGPIVGGEWIRRR